MVEMLNKCSGWKIATAVDGSAMSMEVQLHDSIIIIWFWNWNCTLHSTECTEKCPV